MSRFEPLFPRCDRDRFCGDMYPMCRPEPPPRRCHTDCCDEAIRVPVFGGCTPGCGRRPLPPAAPPVTIVNPWNCCEKAVVTLSVDECGNLVVCVKR